MTTRARWERVTSDAANIGLLVLTVMAAGGVATLAWPYDPVPKLEIAVVGPTHAGGALRVHVDYCKATGYTPIEVRWALIDGVTIILPPTMVTLPVGCRVTTFILPSSPHMTPGRYQLRVNGLYQTWPWRTVIEEAISPVFEVVP